jgi:hypothetical protein
MGALDECSPDTGKWARCECISERGFSTCSQKTRGEVEVFTLALSRAPKAELYRHQLLVHDGEPLTWQ